MALTSRCVMSGRPDGQLLRREGGQLEAIEPLGGLFNSQRRPKRMVEAHFGCFSALFGRCESLLKASFKAFQSLSKPFKAFQSL